MSTAETASIEELQARVKKLAIDKIERHLFICADPTKPICCDRQVSIDSWDYLKLRLKELNLETQVFRTKANCLRVCIYGPILVVYPDRVWYHSVTIPIIERILQEHIIGGEIVKEFAFYKKPDENPNQIGILRKSELKFSGDAY